MGRPAVLGEPELPLGAVLAGHLGDVLEVADEVALLGRGLAIGVYGDGIAVLRGAHFEKLVEELHPPPVLERSREAGHDDGAVGVAALGRLVADLHDVEELLRAGLRLPEDRDVRLVPDLPVLDHVLVAAGHLLDECRPGVELGLVDPAALGVVGRRGCPLRREAQDAQRLDAVAEREARSPGRRRLGAAEVEMIGRLVPEHGAFALEGPVGDEAAGGRVGFSREGRDLGGRERPAVEHHVVERRRTAAAEHQVVLVGAQLAAVVVEGHRGLPVNVERHLLRLAGVGRGVVMPFAVPGAEARVVVHVLAARELRVAGREAEAAVAEGEVDAVVASVAAAPLLERGLPVVVRPCAARPEGDGHRVAAVHDGGVGRAEAPSLWVEALALRAINALRAVPRPDTWCRVDLAPSHAGARPADAGIAVQAHHRRELCLREALKIGAAAEQRARVGRPPLGWPAHGESAKPQPLSAAAAQREAHGVGAEPLGRMPQLLLDGAAGREPQRSEIHFRLLLEETGDRGDEVPFDRLPGAAGQLDGHGRRVAEVEQIRVAPRAQLRRDEIGGGHVAPRSQVVQVDGALRLGVLAPMDGDLAEIHGVEDGQLLLAASQECPPALAAPDGDADLPPAPPVNDACLAVEPSAAGILDREAEPAAGFVAEEPEGELLASAWDGLPRVIRRDVVASRLGEVVGQLQRRLRPLADLLRRGAHRAVAEPVVDPPSAHLPVLGGGHRVDRPLGDLGSAGRRAQRHSAGDGHRRQARPQPRAATVRHLQGLPSFGAAFWRNGRRWRYGPRSSTCPAAKTNSFSPWRFGVLPPGSVGVP